MPRLTTLCLQRPAWTALAYVTACAAGALTLSVGEVSAAPRTSVTVGFEDTVRSFDPRQIVDANSQYIEDLVHCSLVVFDPEGRPAPGVLQSMPTWVNATTLEMQLKAGVLFSDGTPLRPEDVVATYGSLVSDPKFKRASAFSGVEKIELASGGRIRFVLKAPDASFPTNLVVGLLKEKEAKDAAFKAELFTGCGPFVLKSVAINEIRLEKNPKAVPAPKLAGISIKIVRNEKTRYAKLRAGELDIVQNAVSRDTLRTLERRNPSLKIQRRPGLKTTYLGFNMRDKLTGHPAIREAIGLAVNRQEIIDIILNGMAIPAKTILTSDSEYLNTALTIGSADLKKAEQILDQAGFPKKENGIRLEMSLKTTTDVTRISVAKALASQLKRIGIKAIVEPMEWGRFKLDVEEGRVQAWTSTWVGFKDPDIYRYAFASSMFPPNGANRGWYSNPKLDSLLEEGRSKTEFKDRKAAYDAVQLILDVDRPYVFLWHEENFAIVTKSLEGFELYADGRFSALARAYFP